MKGDQEGTRVTTNEPRLNCKLNGGNETIYEHIGGRETCRTLSVLFHDRVASDPLLKTVFPKNIQITTERFALFIAERLGGSPEYSAKRGKTSLRCRHAHVPIGSAEGERWLALTFEAIDEAGIAEPARENLRRYFTEMVHFLADDLLTFYILPLDELRVMLEGNPAILNATDTGRSLLSDAALRWDVLRVQLLLEFGADINVIDHLGHDALYQAVRPTKSGPEANSCATVELLLKHGADVNRRSGPGRLTALHATARRGHVRIGELLLNAGADIEANDSKGETPLRRAVNCRQEAMVQFLLSRGAAPF